MRLSKLFVQKKSFEKCSVSSLTEGRGMQAEIWRTNRSSVSWTAPDNKLMQLCMVCWTIWLFLSSDEEYYTALHDTLCLLYSIFIFCMSLFFVHFVFCTLTMETSILFDRSTDLV